MRELTVDRIHLSSLATDILNSGGTFRFRATGCSMSPFVRDGDILEVRPVDAAAIRYADIVLYCRENRRLIAHRVVGGTGNQHPVELLVQGDASLSSTEIVSLKSVLGRVVSVQRNDKPIVMDTGLWRWLGVFWVALSPFSPWLYRLLVSCKARISLRKPGSEIAS